MLYYDAKVKLNIVGVHALSKRVNPFVIKRTHFLEQFHTIIYKHWHTPQQTSIVTKKAFPAKKNLLKHNNSQVL